MRGEAGAVPWEGAGAAHGGTGGPARSEVRNVWFDADAAGSV
ncbi:hypothetical protein FHU32_001591 [Corynebacterium bovis DSM 20582 = CIP 54.80]|uniref:Uncharacterized protein n=1 Tax=Corynebacterium bovis DSM 20582 = CIP 54.80 TaxID=927655 RepID=A0A8I0CPV7_9CORY|nr:hypothetical protein [Corynebacterium bovis DSM 20582 = CIP 54.80]